MAEIKSLSAIREKWNRVTPGRSEDYKLGIKNPRRDWEASTLAGETNWKTGVDQAAAKGLFPKGVKAAGTEKWKDHSLKKGPTRFIEGVGYAGPDFEKGYDPYHAAYERLTLPARWPRRDPRNLERVRATVNCFIEEKVGS